MLETLRLASKSWIAIGLIFLLILSFAIFGIQDVFRAQIDTTVAEVGDAAIEQQEFEREFQRRMKAQSDQMGTQIDPELARQLGLDRATLDSMITDLALREEAKRLGIGVSDAMVRAEINSIDQFKGPTGEVDPGLFQRVLQENNLTEQTFLTLLRNDLTRNQLLQSVAGGTTVPDIIAKPLAAYRTERRDVEYVVLGKDKAGEIAAPDDAALQALIAERAAEFTAPETRAITLLAVGPKDLAAGITVADADVQTAYETQKQRFDTPEKRVLKQIIFPTEEEAKAARAEIEGGKSFEAIAEARGLTADDTDIGEISKGDATVPAAAFEGPEGGVSQPIQGPFGWLLLKTEKLTPGVTKSFDDVKDELRQAIAEEQAIDKLFPLSNEIEDLRGGGATLEEVANQLSIPLRTIPAIDLEGRDAAGVAIEGLPDGPAFLRDVFLVEQSEESQIADTPSHVYYVIRVDSITPAALRPLAEVREAATAAYVEREQRARLKTLGEAIAAKAATGSMDGAALAKDAGAELKALKGIARGTKSEEFSSALITSLFNDKPGVWKSGAAGQGVDVIVARVTGASTAEPEAGDDTLRTARTEASRELAGDLQEAYRAAVEAATPIKINQELFDRIRQRGQ